MKKKKKENVVGGGIKTYPELQLLWQARRLRTRRMHSRVHPWWWSGEELCTGALFTCAQGRPLTPNPKPPDHEQVAVLRRTAADEAGLYLRLIDFVHHSTLGVRVIKKKKRSRRGSHYVNGNAH